MMHQALDDSDQTRKYGISESMIQALYYDIVCNKVIIRACIMDSEAVTRESGEVAACSLAGERRRPDGSHLHATGPGRARTEKH